MAVVLAVTPLLGQRATTSPRPPWVLESRNTVPLDLPAAVRDAVKWNGFDLSAPTGAVADLDGDGIRDYFLKAPSALCGTGGCMYLVIDGKSAREIANVWGNPLVIRGQTTSGLPDIDVYSHGSASSGSFTSYAFNGSKYVQRSNRSIAGREVTALFAALDNIPRWPPAQLGQASPFEGHWRTDVHPNLKSMSIISVDSGLTFAVTADTVKMTVHTVNPQGRIGSFEEVFQTDGKPHPSTQGPNWTVVARWLNPNLLELLYQNPYKIHHATYSISADLKTLTRVYSVPGHVDKRIFYR